MGANLSQVSILTRREIEARIAGDAERVIADLEDALYASKIVSYAQGFMLFEAASEEFGWDLDPGTIASLWRAGCIIRSRFLFETEVFSRRQRRTLSDQALGGTGVSSPKTARAGNVYLSTSDLFDVIADLAKFSIGAFVVHEPSNKSGANGEVDVTKGFVERALHRWWIRGFRRSQSTITVVPRGRSYPGCGDRSDRACSYSSLSSVSAVIVVSVASTWAAAAVEATPNTLWPRSCR